jgi:hypothetical protein
MEIKYSSEKIEFQKELNALDIFVLDFTSILDKLKIGYVLVSGYVSILFGRNRSSEDIDLIIEEIDLETFKKLWAELYADFECLNSEDMENAYNEYLMTKHSIRFSRKKEFIPNIEIKFQKTSFDIWTLKNKKKVVLNGKIIFISPLEMQIPFKLYLGTEKDIEDAKYLFNLFKDKIDNQLLQEFNRKLKIEDLFIRYLR